MGSAMVVVVGRGALGDPPHASAFSRERVPRRVRRGDILLKKGAKGQTQGEILIGSLCFRSSAGYTSMHKEAGPSYFKFQISVALKTASLSSTSTTAL